MLIPQRRGVLSRSLISGFAAFTFLLTQAPLAGLAQEAAAPPPSANAANSDSSAPGPAPGKATQQQLQQLVSPIALYPDLLVAQILAASTYPTQIVEAERWLQDNQKLKGQQLSNAVDQQPWDPSVKSLTQYPPVLANLNQNLSWTSALGQAYYNQPSDVMKAIQTLRHMAQQSGTLKSTPQQKVVVENASGGASAAPTTTVTEGSSGNTVIVIQPAQPNVVYVPQYNPTTAYGQPVAAPPGYSSSDLLMTGLVSFGAGLLVGDLIGSNSNNWGCNWHGGNVTYNHNVYVSNSNAVPSRWGGYHPYGPSHPYYGNQPGHYGYNNGYPRPYGSYNHPYQAPKMPSQYNQPRYQQDVQHAQNQREVQNAKNKGANDLESHGWSKSPTPENNSFRGYGNQNKQGGQHSWGGKTQPGGFSQAASQRGRDSFSGGNDRWGGDKKSGGDRFGGKRRF